MGSNVSYSISYWSTAIKQKPTFHEIMAFTLSVLLVALIGALLLVGRPVPDFLVGAFTLIIGVTFGVRVGRTDEIIKRWEDDSA